MEQESASGPISKRLRSSAREPEQRSSHRDAVEATGGRETEEKDKEEEVKGGEVEAEEEEEEEDERVEEQMKEFFSEMDMDISRQKRNLFTEGLRVPRRKSLLPTHLYSVMGCANLRLARGDSAGAIELCLEVIRQAPHSPEPYLTLSTVYEEKGDTQKLLQILVISAHLKRNDVELWAKAGQLAEELSNLPLAARCYQQACRFEPANLMYVWKKASLYQSMGEAGKAITTYQQLLQMLPPTNGHDILEVYKELAQLYYHHCNDPQRAINVLHTAVHSHMPSADDEAIHLLVELHISSKNYQSAYELITMYYNMVPDLMTQAKSRDQPATPTSDEGHSFQQMLSSAIRVSLSSGEAEEGVMEEGEGSSLREAENLETSELLVPDNLPVDMRVKLAVCLIHHSLPLPPSLLSPVTSHPEEYGDLFIDLAEAYTENGSPSQALPLLSTLVHTHPFNLAGVWLKHAECLHTLQDMEGAAMSYSQVLSLAPHHTDTRLTLATIYVQLGRVEDALALLESEQHEHFSVAMETTEECPDEQESGLIRLPEQTDYTLEGLRVLVHRYTVQVKSERVSGYVSDGVSLLNVLFRDVVHRKDLRSIMHLSAKTLLERIGTKLSTNMADSLLPLQEWWTLFFTTCKGLLKMGPAHHKQLFHLVLCAATLKSFEDPAMECDYLLFVSSLCCMLSEFELAFTFIKNVCIKLNHTMLWNILNSLPLTKGFQKFLLRQCFKHPSNLTLLRIHANYSLATSNYKFALCLYEQSYRSLPPSPLILLSIGCVYFNMASQKGALSRNQLVLQGVAFFHKYLRLRGKCQESMYNLGRAFQQIGVVHAACHFYRQALALEPENNDPKWRLASDLRPEAAFNLSHIYLASGNRPLALQVLHRYCTI